MSNQEGCDKSVNESKACPVPVGNTICGETNSLEIMKEFNRLYEERMQEVDSKAGGDCLQEKIKLQQEWIRNLTQQNEMLVRAVQELEYEATERVQQLEEKLHKSAQCLCEGERLLKEKECTVQELTQKLQHYSTFGDVECLAKELKCRQEECESLKQSMVDMRRALTEEVAVKHDEVIGLKKDCKILEDRCLQADKQTAFKEDIIRELRKEIKQLKQQFTQEEITKLNATIEELHANLEKTRIAQDQEEMVHQKEISQLNKTISSLEEELKKFGEKYEKDIKVQANLESKESELVKALKDSESKMRLEIEKRNNEIQMLRNKVNELELALNTCEERAANLQEAVTLYSKSVSVLETTEEDAQNQIQQQKITIANLQQALVEAKQEVDEMRRKTQENVSGGTSWTAWFGLSSSDVTNNNSPSNSTVLTNKSVHDI